MAHLGHDFSRISIHATTHNNSLLASADNGTLDSSGISSFSPTRNPAQHAAGEQLDEPEGVALGGQPGNTEADAQTQVGVLGGNATSISTSDLSKPRWNNNGQFKWWIRWATDGKSGWNVQRIDNTYSGTRADDTPITNETIGVTPTCRTRTQPRTSASSLMSARGGLLQRKCACGGASGMGEMCAECREKDLGIQRQVAWRDSAALAPPIVHEVLRSPGQPLDDATQAYFELRFGHDFSRVRVHTDAWAAESARAVNAIAYTVGDDMVFDSGRFAPTSSAGRELLAHELTHVIQQSSPLAPGGSQAAPHPSGLLIGPLGDRFEQEAERVSALESRHAASAGSQDQATRSAIEVDRVGYPAQWIAHPAYEGGVLQRQAPAGPVVQGWVCGFVCLACAGLIEFGPFDLATLCSLCAGCAATQYPAPS
jgi:hypothetical protein